ncbi:hypothetical protein [Streptomyces sp. NPDC003943]
MPNAVPPVRNGGGTGEQWTVLSWVGPQTSPHGQAVFLLAWGAAAALWGWFAALKRTGVADTMAAWVDQSQQDYVDAYGKGTPPTAAVSRFRRLAARFLGWAFAVPGPANVAAGIGLLVRS